MGEDNEQLPQHGVEPEQRLKQRIRTVGNGAKPTHPSLQQVGPRYSHRTAQGKACRRRVLAARLATGGICPAEHSGFAVDVMKYIEAVPQARPRN